MSLKQSNEDVFIQYLKTKFQSKKAFVGIGDDCSVIDFDSDNYQISSTDLLVEDVHFSLDYISAEQLGKKAIAVNLSDIAAMGGTPLSIFVSLALPKYIDDTFKKNFFEGINFYCKQYDLDLLGGDLSSSPDKLIVNIHVQGIVNKNKVKLRSGARPGDVICVSGSIGESAIGLKILQTIKQSQNKAQNQDTLRKKDYLHFIDKHLNPKPKLEFGQYLAEQDCVTAMLDLSDGICVDIKHICRLSNCGARIELDKLPLLNNTKEFYQALSSLDYYSKVISSGEDYELLFCVQKKNVKKLKEDFNSHFKSQIYEIGEITKEENLSYYLNNSSVFINEKPFRHF